MVGPEVLPGVSVIVPTRNRRERVLRCVAAVLADPATSEVVVVDDGSDDGTSEAIRQLGESDGRVRATRVEHFGADFARQVGTQLATAEVVLYLDDDVLAEPGLVTGHAQHHASGTSLVILGYMPTVLPSHRRRGDFPQYLYAENYEHACRIWSTDPDTILRTMWGGNVSMRRGDALTVGLVSRAGHMPYREDQEFGLRLRAAGLTGQFDRNLRARHDHGRDIAGFLREARARAIGAEMIHQLHEDELGTLTTDRYERGLPLPARLAIRAARWRPAAPVVLAAVRVTIAISGLVRWWKLESLSGIVAMHMIEVRTILDERQRAKTAP